ncbi:MAG TPA: hypothetical protein VJ124_06535 [Pyrinomonadaceae bacterium]|nr:hypothetical protein [Pyrinomonadaceae bacterium]
MKIWHNLFDDSCRRKILARLRALKPDANRRWGRMSAPQMVAHLTDQMHHALGDDPVTARPGKLRWPPVRFASIYLLPWPKGRIQGPPEAFTTQPTSWEADIRELERLLERFAARDPEDNWPDHALFGHMSGRDWGVFVHKHCDHHLRQFGV